MSRTDISINLPLCDHSESECGLKGDLVKVTLDTATGRIVRDDSDLPVVQVLYDYKPNEVAVDPILLYYK